MKKILLSCMALLLSIVLFTGCGAVMEGFKEGLQEGLGQTETANTEGVQTVTSYESTLSIDFPKSWKEEALNDVATIQMARTSKEQYLIVIEESSEDFDDDFTASDYIEIIMATMSGAVGASETPVIKDVVAGGIAAKQFELSGSVEKIKVKYLVTCLENDGVFHQFTAWSLQSKYDEAKPVFDSILEGISF